MPNISLAISAAYGGSTVSHIPWESAGKSASASAFDRVCAGKSTVFRGTRAAIPISKVRGKRIRAGDMIVAIATRKELHVHGGGMIFSLSKVPKRAYLSAADVRKAIEATEGSGSLSSDMLKAIASAMADYLGPRLLRHMKLDHGASQKALEAITRDATKLAARIESLDQDYLLAIEDNRFEPFDEAEVEKFDLRMLCRKLNRLSHAAQRTRECLKPNGRGAPTAGKLDKTIKRLLEILERADLPVEATYSGSRAVRPKVSGQGGVLLLAVFKAFDRHTSETNIFHSIDRVRRCDE